MSVFEQMYNQAKKMAKNPGAALKRLKGNASSQMTRAGKAAEKAAGSAGMALTRGAGLEPARNLRDVLKKSYKEVTK